MPEKLKDVESRMSPVNYIGLGILLVCYLGAIWNVFQVKKDEMLLGKKVVRLCHWQLEMGVRDAIDDMARSYEALYPDRKVIQIPITERVYAQWVTTQLIGRTAPDLIEIGMFNVLEYLGRYFIPLTDELRKPNPYNADNRFKNTPWMETFTDGLQNSYIPDLVDYYSVGFSQFNVRMFYNKHLFKKILGTEVPPKTLEELFEYCDKIQAYAKARDAEVERYNKTHGSGWWTYIPFMPSDEKKPYVLFPIASSRYQVGIFKGRYASMLSADRYLATDLSLTGNTTSVDCLHSLITGKLSLDDPQYKACQQIVHDMAKYFPPGFMSIDRMDAGFSFVQGRSAMITSGSWDASSFIKQVADQPSGDVILSVDDAPVKDSASARSLLMAVKDGAKVRLKLNREGGKAEATLVAASGATLWERYGLEIDDFKALSGQMAPTVSDVDSISAAATAGVLPRKCFEVGIFDFPQPSKDNPLYGKYFVGTVAESSNTGFSFGITKFSKNMDVAIDFLQFCTCPKSNQRLNEVAQWIPAVKDAEPTPFLKAFVPHFDGYWGDINFEMLGPRSKTKVSQVFWPYVSHEIDYGKFSSTLLETLPAEAAYDFVEQLKASTEKTPDKHIMRSVFLKDAVFSDDDPKLKADAMRRLASCWDIILTNQLECARLMSVIGPLVVDRPKNKFSEAFFSVYDRLAQQGGGSK